MFMENNNNGQLGQLTLEAARKAALLSTTGAAS